MKYKVGDKVRLSEEFYIEDYRGALAKIIRVQKNCSDFPYKINCKSLVDCPVHLYEIEPTIKVGQQLEFDFMEEV